MFLYQVLETKADVDVSGMAYSGAVVRYAKNIDYPLNQAVAAEFRAELGRQRDVTQAELAERAGVPRDTVGKLLRGEAMFDVEQIDRLALALHLRPDVIFARADASLDGKPAPSAERRKSV